MNEKLTPQQHKLICALLTARSDIEAARVTGTKERTLRRWMKLPQFQQALREAQSERKLANNRAIQSLDEKAIQTLSNLLDDPATPAYVKHQVAVDILGLSTRSYESDALENRLSELERIFENDE